MKKKIFALMLTLCMVLTMVPGMAWAASGETNTQNPKVEKLYWIFCNDNVMVKDNIIEITENGKILTRDEVFADEGKYVTDKLDMSAGNGVGGYFVIKDNSKLRALHGIQSGNEQCIEIQENQNGIWEIMGKNPGEAVLSLKSDDGSISYELKVTCTADGITLRTSEYTAVDDDSLQSSMGNGFFWTDITMYDGETKVAVAVDDISIINKDSTNVDNNAYGLSPEAKQRLNECIGDGTIKQGTDSNSFQFTPTKAGNAVLVIQYNGQYYFYKLFIHPNDINPGGGSDTPYKPEHTTYFFEDGDISGDLSDKDISYEDKYINMSLSPAADENCFYLAVPGGTNYQPQAFHLINGTTKDSKDEGDTRDRDPNGLRCEGDNLFENYFKKSEAKTVTIDSKEYQVYKINLTKYLGHGDLRVIVKEDGDRENHVDLRFALNVTVKGDAEGVKRLYNAADAQRNLFGFESEYADIELKNSSNGRTGAYYNAMDVYYEGKDRYKQGDYSELALELADGYVLNNISFLVGGEEKAATFSVERQYEYAVLDAEGNMLQDNGEHFTDTGWNGASGNYGGIVKDGPEKGQEKQQGFVMTKQVVLGAGAGANTQQDAADFLAKQPYKGTQYSLKYLGVVTPYLVFYDDYYSSEKPIEIVFEVQKLPETSEVKVEDFDGKICIMPESNQGGHKFVVTSEVLQDFVLTGKDGLNEKLKKEYHDGYTVEKVFEITATKDGQQVSDLKSYVTITIPRSMFKGNPKHYKVMNVDDNGNMVEMETTYEENGAYIVFKTGHLSKYAIVTNEDLSSGGTSSGGSSGGGGAVIPTETPVDKAKKEANTAISDAAAANKYDEAEQEEVKKILDKAAADIKNAKTEEEVKAIREAAQAELDKVLTTEEKVQIASVGSVDKEIFKAKSKYSRLKGKRAIKLTWNVPNGMKFDGFEIYRSTKKFSGYGKTPYFTTTKTSYINSKDLVKGKTYYYKVRAFVIINGEKFYTDYSTKAFRTMK